MHVFVAELGRVDGGLANGANVTWLRIRTKRVKYETKDIDIVLRSATTSQTTNVTNQNRIQTQNLPKDVYRNKICNIEVSLNPFSSSTNSDAIQFLALTISHWWIFAHLVNNSKTTRTQDHPSNNTKNSKRWNHASHTKQNNKQQISKYKWHDAHWN